MIEWTDELRAQVIKDYKDAEPTPKNSMDIVRKIAEDIGGVPNGVRSILSKAGAYVKTSGIPAAGGTPAAKSTRVNKADAQKALSDLIESLGKEADQSIIDKLTGKAALYLVDVFSQEVEDAE